MSAAPASCGRCESSLEQGDIRCPICHMAAPVTAASDKIRVEVLRCEGCGAAVAYEIAARAPACAFCGSVMRVEIPADPMEAVELRLPFTVDRHRAENAHRKWLEGLGWFAGARRADWAPHAGRVGMVFDDVVASASRGLTADETAALIPSYDLATAEQLGEEAEPGSTVEQFDVTRSTARERVASFITRRITDRLQQGTIPGRRFRNVHAAVVLRRLVTRRFVFPSWVLAYRYRGRLYRVVISGQNESCLVGAAPYSMAKILAAIFGGLAAVAILVALVAAL